MERIIIVGSNSAELPRALDRIEHLGDLGPVTILVAVDPPLPPETPMKNPMLAIAAMLGLHGGLVSPLITHRYVKQAIPEPGRRRRGKRGGGRGGFTPPRHARARAWKKAFGGIAVPRIDNSHFMFQ